MFVLGWLLSAVFRLVNHLAGEKRVLSLTMSCVGLHLVREW